MSDTPIYTATTPGHDPVYGDHSWHHHKKRFSWQPIAAGIAAALAVQVVLGLIGLGLGFGVAQPAFNAPPWHQTPSIGTLMWAGVSLLTAAFYGGFIAARLSKSTCRHEGVLSGIVTWAGSVLLVAFLLANSYGGLFGGAAQIMGHFAGPHGPEAYYEHLMSMQRPAIMPGSATNTDTLNHQELATMPSPVADETAHRKAALAAGVVLGLAALVAGFGGVLGAEHVKHHREHHMPPVARPLV